MRKSRKSTSKINKALAASWLEAQFHWRPLVSDLESAAETFAKLGAGVESERISAIGVSDAVTDIPIATYYVGPVLYNRGRRIRETAKVKFYGSVRTANPANSGSFSSQALQSLGFNFGNFLPTVWELVPFSFVADYFSNLGDMISAYSFPVSAITWMARTTRIDSEVSLTNQSWTLQPDAKTEYGFTDPGHYFARLRFMTRLPFNPNNLLPSLRWEVPGAQNLKKYLNLTALAVVLS
jgi:hypothetical protein